MSSWKSRLSAPRDKLSSALQCPFFTRAHARRICSFSRIHCAICLSQKILSQAEGALFLPERTLSGSPKMTFLSGLKGSSICIAIKMRHKNGAPRMRHKKWRPSESPVKASGYGRCTIGLEGPPNIGESSIN